MSGCAWVAKVFDQKACTFWAVRPGTLRAPQRDVVRKQAWVLGAGSWIWLAACDGGTRGAGQANPMVGGAPTEGGAAAQEPGRGAAGEVDRDDDEITAAELAGHSFTLSESLCPPDWPPEVSLLNEPTGLVGFHVRVPATGELELVSYTRGGGQSIHVGQMRRSGQGWEIDDVPTCSATAYVFENEFETRRHVTARLQLQFTRRSEGAPLKARLTATSQDTEPIVSWADLDTTPPVAQYVDVKGLYGIDGALNEPFVATFLFDEPVSEGWVTVKDRLGAPVETQLLKQGRYLVGFRVDDALSSDARIDTILQDLAGNRGEQQQPFPGFSLAPIQGDFEGQTDIIVDRWSDGVAYRCGYVHVGSSSASVDGELSSDLGPLVGERSLLIGDGCAPYLRLLRAPGTSVLRFEARAIAVAPQPLTVQPGITVWSLDAGDAPFHAQASEINWLEDAVVSTPAELVSIVQTVTLELPEAGDNLLVALGAEGGYLWLDSLRAE